jgi:hypothetical protein
MFGLGPGGHIRFNETHLMKNNSTAVSQYKALSL